MKGIACIILVSVIYFWWVTSMETGLSELSINAWTSLTLSCFFLFVSYQRWATLLALAESFLVLYSVLLHYMLSNYIYNEFIYDYYPAAQTVVYVLELVILGNLLVQELRYDSGNDFNPRDSGNDVEFSRI